MLPENVSDPTTCDVGWDKKVSSELRKQGLNQEQIGVVLGILVEHREKRYQIGYSFGFETGYNKAITKTQTINKE